VLTPVAPEAGIWMSRSTAASKAERQKRGVNDGATKSVETKRRDASPMIVRPRRMDDDLPGVGLTPRLFED
jgi:hypothetical protein